MTRGLAGAVARLPRRLATAVCGSITLKFAFGSAALMMLAAGAIDLTRVHAWDAQLQDVADAAALTAAPSLALATEGVVARQRAEAYVAAAMAQWPDAPQYQGTYEVINRMGQRAIRVRLAANRPSFFANLMPPGGWNFAAEATASSVGLVPLCVLSTAVRGTQGGVRLSGTARMASPACLVHSNRDIQVHGGSIRAASVQAVTQVSGSGSVSPAPVGGAAPIEDPFAGLDLTRNVNINRLCTLAERRKLYLVSSGTHRVPAGRHCASVRASGTARIILEPGDHFFLSSHLELTGDSRLEGRDVAVFFDSSASMSFEDRATVSLEGRESGPYAGIVLGATRNNTQEFFISSNNVENLLGAIYIPEARLRVVGAGNVARDSAWTVIVAKQIHLEGAASMFVNANYAGSSVPVPAGVGPRGGRSRLIE